MKPTRSLQQTFLQAGIAVAATAALVACGGGGGDSGNTGNQVGLSNETAQGYSADSATMPLSSSTAVETSIGSIESAISAAAGSSRMQPQSATAQPLATSGACALGGT